MTPISVKQIVDIPLSKNKQILDQRKNLKSKEQLKQEVKYSKEEAKNLGIEELSKKIEERIEDKSTILR